MVMDNSDLHIAKNNKSDEFYTQPDVIAAELEYYTRHFEGARVYCNCDDPSMSMFWVYFHKNFKRLGLEKLVSTRYEKGGISYKMEYSGGNDMDVSSGTMTGLLSDGDFRSRECVGLLDESDIVVTNPPFSLFRDYVNLLMLHKKRFLIIGNMNALTYKDFFPYVKDGDVWLGPSISSGDRSFWVPDDYELKAAGCGIDENGRKYIRVKGVRWFTNLDHEKRHERLILEKTYEPGMYELYSNYGAINVDHVKDIPDNYRGVMGVPITFLDKYCPEQFEITGFRKGFDGKDLYYIKDNKKVCPYLRILIRCRR